ncbi:MAG TPA: hypothetical protein VK009_22555 [Chloroflexota bacterium]|nr:hypothetical protein [Chloroflexota bacterium]
MELFWYIVGIMVFAAVFAVGIIFTAGWLIAIGLVLLPLTAVWGMVSSGPGSKYNPYHH